MELWAAIDLLDGAAVTLVQGRDTEKTVWKQGPVQLAERWQREGADGLHIIDLDAALGKGSNQSVITKMVEESRVPVQVGGGIRSEERADEWLERGVERAVIGTLAYANPAALGSLLGKYGPGRIVVAADYKDGQIVTKGWTEGHGLPVEDAAERFERAGVVNLLTTSVGRDGTRSGPDVETVRMLSGSRRKMKIIASGGIRDIVDLTLLAEAGAAGAVIGRALYEDTVSLAEAKRRLS